MLSHVTHRKYSNMSKSKQPIYITPMKDHNDSFRLRLPETLYGRLGTLHLTSPLIRVWCIHIHSRTLNLGS